MKGIHIFSFSFIIIIKWRIRRQTILFLVHSVTLVTDHVSSINYSRPIIIIFVLRNILLSLTFQEQKEIYSVLPPEQRITS